MTRAIFTILLAMIICIATIRAAEVQTDIEYAKVDGESLTLDLSVPEGEGPFPVAIYVHGGGWSKGDKAGDTTLWMQPLTDAKFTWFSINYRLAPAHRWPACIDDARTAIRWVKTHAAEYKGDPERVALLGYSAGGHLAAYAAATAKDDTRVQAVVLFAAPTSLEGDSERRGGLSPSLQNLFGRGQEIDDEARAILRETSPINYVSAESPPCLLIHGTVDESVLYSQSQDHQKKLQSLGVPCDLITIPGGSHKIELWETIDTSYKQKMIDWLRKRLAPTN